MVRGLAAFRDHFRGYEACYVLIGGTACDLWMADSGLAFRATRDLDVVLVVEALNSAFFQRFWDFIKAAGYKSLQRSDRRPEFYRFTDADDRDYPFRIELLSRNALGLPEGVHLTPIPADEDISTLSAILLDDAYYRFVMESRVVIDDVPTIPAQCIIPLKARAYLDLTERRIAGDNNVRSGDIKKHRNDVFRLYLTLTPDDRFSLPSQLRDDLVRFLGAFPADAAEWGAIRSAVGEANLPDTPTVLSQIRAIFGL